MKDLCALQRAQLIESERRSRISTYKTLGFLFSILLGCLIIFGDHKVTKHKVNVRKREVELQQREVEFAIDERARVAHHFIDGIPRCVANCVFPQALNAGCAISDTECICQSLQFLGGDVPPERRIEMRWKPPCIEEARDGEGDKLCLPREEAEAISREEFKTCWDECSVQDHVQTPFYISNYCSSLGIIFELPRLWTPLEKRQTEDFLSVSAPTYTYSTDITTTKATDGTIATTAGTLTTGSSTTRKSSTSTTRRTSFPTFTPPSSDNGGLSRGAKIAIGVTVPLVVLIAVGIFVFWFFHVRKQRKARNSPAFQETYSGMPELGDGAYPRHELASEPTMNQHSDTKNKSILRYLGIGEAVAVEKPTDIKKPDAVKYRTAPRESGGVIINEMDGIAQPPRAYELHNKPSSKPSSPVQRKPAPVSPGTSTNTSSFPAPWHSTGDEGFSMPGMMPNLGDTSAKSLPLQENKPTLATHPQLPTTAPLPPQSHILPSDSPSDFPTVAPHTSATGSPSMSTPQTAPSLSQAQSSMPETLQDQELANMEREMAAVRAKKERLKQVAELEEREEALRKGIDARKSQMSGAPSGGGPS